MGIIKVKQVSKMYNILPKINSLISPLTSVWKQAGPGEGDVTVSAFVHLTEDTERTAVSNGPRL